MNISLTPRPAGAHYAEPAQPALVHGSWRGVGRRVAAAGTTAVMVGSLLMPNVALAAELISVDGQDYSEVGAHDENYTWHWESQDNLTLNGYSGGSIAATGKLDVTYSGENTVTQSQGYGAAVLDVDGKSQDAELTFSAADSSSTLNVNASSNAIAADGDVNILGGTVNVNAESTSSAGNAVGIMSSSDVNVDGATLNISSNTLGSGAVGILCEPWSDVNPGGSTVSFKNSTVNINASSKSLFSTMGIYVARSDGNATVSFDNSDVSIKTTGTAVFAAAASGYTANIFVNGSSITTPEDGNVYKATGSRGGASLATIKSASTVLDDDATEDDFVRSGAGEVVITADKKADGGKGEDGSDKQSSEQNASASETAAAQATVKAGVAAGANLTQTGDDSAVAVIATAMAGTAAIAAGVTASRRRNE